MAYLGNVPAEAYTSIDKQVITGDGGTSYTLDHSVANENEIEVFVNNVRQEPSVAYTVSGTALTMTGDVESTDDFYVVFQGKAIQTTSHPEGQDLKARDGYFSGDLGVGVSDPSYTVDVASSGNTQIHLKASGQADGLEIGQLSADGGNAITATNNNYLKFGTNDTERMRITSGGNVGIGNTNPRTPLEIRSANLLGSTFTGTTNGEGLRVTQTNYTSGNYVSLVESSYDDGSATPVVRMGAKFNASGSHLSFGTSSSYGSGVTNEALTINSAGNILIGSSTETPGAGNTSTGVGIRGGGRLFVSADGTFSSFNRNNENGTLINFYRSGTGVGDISVTTSSTSYNTSSDHRLKENVEDMTGAITRVKNLQPRRFSWIVDDEDAANVDGFLAHEAQSVVPEAVTGTHDEVDDDGNPVYQAIDQSKLVPLLTGALQEAIAKIEALETRVQALEDA